VAVRPAGLGLVLFLTLGGLCSGQGFDLAFRTETGFFNRAYQDRQYLTNSSVSFGVPYGSVGAEAEHRDAEGNLWSVGLAQTTIGSGRVYNFDQWENQPFTVMSFASVSVGKDFGWWELGLGIGALVQLKDFSASSYLAADGTEVAGRAGGLDWNRRESYTLVTGLLRVFPEADPHLVVKVARGPLSLTENLMHLQGVWPLNGSQLDAELGFSSPLGIWFHGDGVLRSNERLSLGWSLGGPSARVGLRLGFLLRTIVADSGEVDLLRRLSGGIDWAIGL